MLDKIRKKSDQALTCFRLWKIFRLPRYRSFETTLLGKKILANDSRAFFYSFQEIFINKIYQFPAETDAPVIVDCGANIGLSVIFFKKIHPRAIITAFEPDPKIFEVLQRNIANFNYSDITLLPFALGDKESTVYFQPEGADGGKVVTETSQSSIPVRSVKLSPYIENKTIDLLKIDIEGKELEVIREIKPFLGSVKNLFIEYHSSINHPQNLSELLRILEDAGFRYYMSNSGVQSRMPFMGKKVKNDLDLQLNIFAAKSL